MLHIHESIIHIIFVACVVLMEAILPYFNLKPDDCNLATTNLLLKLSQTTSNTYTGKALKSLIEMELMFSKIHPRSISEFNVREKTDVIS